MNRLLMNENVQLLMKEQYTLNLFVNTNPSKSINHEISTSFFLGHDD